VTASAPLRPLRLFFPFALAYKGRIALAVFALLGAAFTTLSFPLAIRSLLEQDFVADNREGLGEVFLILLGLSLLLALMSSLRFYAVTWLGERIVRDVRAHIYDHLLHLGAPFYDQGKAGDMASRLGSDTTLIKSVFGSSASLALRNIIMFCGSVIMMIVTSPQLSLWVVGLIPLLILPLIAFGRRVRQRSAQAQEELAQVSALTIESLQGIKIVQSFVAETFFIRVYTKAVTQAFEAAKAAIVLRAGLTFTIISVVFCGILGVLWIGTMQVVSGALTAGLLGQFVFYAVLAGGAMGELSQVWGDLAQASGAAERLAAYLKEPRLDNQEPLGQQPLAKPFNSASESPLIIFDKVSFGYDPQRFVLQDVSFTIEQGQTVAVIGPSGAGKTTLFQVLLGFYQPQKGKVSLQGLPLEQMTRSRLRADIAYVPQDPHIFSWSVADNITLGDDPSQGQSRVSTMDLIREAARRAHALDFIEALPQGFDTLLGERGVRLSGGQKQRLALARAFYKNAPILLLDEATNALDAESEHEIQKALDDLMQDKTTLVIAHRLSTVRSADTILVLDQGTLVEQGSHEDLMRNKGLYAFYNGLQSPGQT
jgi:ATP-binding cassette subfamily B protein